MDLTDKVCVDVGFIEGRGWKRENVAYALIREGKNMNRSHCIHTIRQFSGRTCFFKAVLGMLLALVPVMSGDSWGEGEMRTFFMDDFSGNTLSSSWHADCPVEFSEIIQLPPFFGSGATHTVPISADKFESYFVWDRLTLCCGLEDVGVEGADVIPDSQDMWAARNGAPIMWLAAPPGSYVAETQVTLPNVMNKQLAGIVVYEGPDGANGSFTCGLDTWPGAEYMTVALQRLGGGFNRFSPQLGPSDKTVMLRMRRDETGATDTYTFWYKRPADADWIYLSDYSYSGAGARVGLFLKDGEGTFDYIVKEGVDSLEKNADGYMWRDSANFAYFKIDRDATPAIEPAAGSVTIPWNEMASLAPGHYDALYITDVTDSNGPIELRGAEVQDGRVISAAGGSIRFSGPLADLIGDAFNVESGKEDDLGLRLIVTFYIPDFLGGGVTQITFLYSNTGYLAPLGMEINIPQTISKGGFKIQRVKIIIDPDGGKFGGGGLIGLPTLGNTFGGWLVLKTDFSQPKIVDVTLVGAGEGNLNIPIGSSGMLLDYVGGMIENDLGLSNPQHWLASNFIGEFDIISALSMNIAGNKVPAFKISGKGVWSVHDGSFDFTGTGKIGGAIEIMEAKHHYSPLFNVTTTGEFDLQIYRGEAEVRASKDGVGASFSGSMQIPSYVPVVGGMSLASVGASLDGSELAGRASLSIAHGVKEVCNEVCSYFPWPLDTICNTVCDMVPNFFDVPFDFVYDLGTSLFSFSVHTPWKGEGQEDLGFTNWKPIRSMPGKIDGAYSFEVSEDCPSIIFRTEFSNTEVSAVNMTVTTPSGLVLNSDEGAFPEGYAEIAGFSRFNGEAHEQVILLNTPEAGTYQVTVANVENLGEFTVTAHVQDQAPGGEFTQIAENGMPGQYIIQWTAHDDAGVEHIKLHLDEDREGRQGYIIETFDVPHVKNQSFSHVLDTTMLEIPAGHYFIMLEVDDGITTPFKVYSDAMILAKPKGCPEPPTGLKFKEGDHSVTLRWEPSVTEGIQGYLIQWSGEHEDPGVFGHQQWVPVPGEKKPMTELKDLTNSLPLLVCVVAVGADHRRSIPSEILRVTPHAGNSLPVPQFHSLPDENATAGYPYFHMSRVTFSGSGAEQCVWWLDEAPAGMNIDGTSGLIQWTPAEAHVGLNTVTVSAALVADGQGAVSSQTFRVYVYPPDQLHGLRPHPFMFETHPGHDTKEGIRYTYQPMVAGTEHANSLQFQLLAGPTGMKIDARSGLIEWDVPKGAQGAWVRFAAVINGQYTIEQDYYLFVLRKEMPLDDDQGCVGCYSCTIRDYPNPPGGDMLIYAGVILLLLVLGACCSPCISRYSVHV